MDAFMELLEELKSLCADLVRFVKDWKIRWKRI